MVHVKQSPDHRRRLLRNLLLLSLPGLVIPLVALEVGLRVAGYTPWYHEAAAFMPSRDPEMLYELRPGFRGLHAGVPVSINSQGFRGEEPSSETGYRVVVVGDSIAFGQGVRDNETLPAHLKASLRKKMGGPVDVVNLGVPAYNTCQEYLRFKEKGLSLNPAAVILVYYENDVDPSNIRVVQGRVVTVDVRTSLFGEYMAWMRKHGTLYNLVWTRWNLLKLRPFSMDEYRQVLRWRFSDANPGWRASKACLAQILSLTGTRRTRVIVIPYPVLSNVTGIDALNTAGLYPVQHYIDTICTTARSVGAECFDVVPLLRTAGIRLRVSVVEQHPTGEVFALIATRIAAILP